jgi:hypothetical protein
VTDYDLSMYLRPSRYAEADKFYGFAATEFGNYADSTTIVDGDLPRDSIDQLVFIG